MNVGPCLSPISIAVQGFHKPKKKNTTSLSSSGNGELINPIVAKRIVYSPPLKGKNKRKRKRSLYEEFNAVSLHHHRHEEEPLLPPPMKKRKLELAQAEQIQQLSIGKSCRVRFSLSHPNLTLAACIVVIENFGVVVLIQESNTHLPNVFINSKYWAKWNGDIIDGKPLLNIIHQAQ